MERPKKSKLAIGSPRVAANTAETDLQNSPAGPPDMSYRMMYSG